MTKSKHTPGPWKVDGPALAGAYIVENDAEQVASTFGAGSESLSNAHLIAAAPEMLEALKQTVRVIAINGGPSADIERKLSEKLQSLIVKAEGKNDD